MSSKDLSDLQTTVDKIGLSTIYLLLTTGLKASQNISAMSSSPTLNYGESSRKNTIKS
jgi:hypothetical protein